MYVAISSLAWAGPPAVMIQIRSKYLMEPTIDTIATDYNGRVRVGKLNVDDNGGVATRYGIRGIPTLLLFKSGRVVEQRVGAIGKSDVQKMLDAHL